MNIHTRFFIFIIFLFLMKPSFADVQTIQPVSFPVLNTWNGTGSIVSNSSGSHTGYGLTQDVSRVHPSSSGLSIVSEHPVVFFQWELDSDDGSKLEINAANYTSATITYGYWSSSKEQKFTHANVSLPFILDPSLDGLSNADGQWFTIAVSLPFTPASSADVTAKATNANGTNHTRSTTEEIRLNNSNYWGGNGSLISKRSGDKTGFGMTQDVAAVKNGLKSSVFFQWEIDSTDGKAVRITSQKGCFQDVKVTTGDWDIRSNDSTRQVTLPYTVSTNKSDGGWVLIRVDLLTNATCDDNVSAEIIEDTGGTIGGESFYGATAPSELVAVNLVHPVNGPSTTEATASVQLQWTDRSNIETGYTVKIYPANIAVPTIAQTQIFDRPAIVGNGSRGYVTITDLASDIYSFQICPTGSALVNCATGDNFTIVSENGTTSPDPSCKPVITRVSALGEFVHWDYDCNTNPYRFVVKGQCGNSPFGQIGPLGTGGFPNNGELRLANILVGIGATGYSQVCAVSLNGNEVCSNIGAAPCLSL